MVLSKPQSNAAPGAPDLRHENNFTKLHGKGHQDDQVSAHQLFDSDNTNRLGTANTGEEERRGSRHENRPSCTFLIRELTHICFQVHENASMVSSHLTFVRSRTYMDQERIQKLHLKPTFDLSQRFIKILSIGRSQSVLPWPASQYTDKLAGAFDQSSEMQKSTLNLLSCYTHLLKSHDDILSCFMMVIEQWAGTQQVQYDDHAVDSYARIQQIRVSAERMVQMLRRTQGILGGLRKAIRSSSMIWDSDAADLTSHSIDTRSAVLAVHIRQYYLDSRINCMHNFLTIKFLELVQSASPQQHRSISHKDSK